MATINAIGSGIPIEVSKGGTGAATLTVPSILVGSGTSAITTTAATSPTVTYGGGSCTGFTNTTGYTLNIDLADDGPKAEEIKSQIKESLKKLTSTV